MSLLGGIIGGVAGIGGSILGGISKNKMLKEQIRMVNEQKQENEDWYNRRYNEDATQRADAQAMLTQTAEMIKQRNKQAAGSAAVMGTTDEGVAATKAANANAIADATSKIAIAGNQQKDAIENQYRATDNALDETIRGLKGQKVNALDMVGNLMGAGLAGYSNGSGLA